MKLVLFSVFLCFICLTDALSQGAIRLVQNGVADTSQAWSAGIVQIYYKGSWGNICDDAYFDQYEADVICRQLGYAGANSYSNTGTTTQYGIDNAATAISELDCGLYDLTVTQCEFSQPDFVSSCDGTDVIVTCSSTKIWDSPTSGDIRLTGGDYSNEGLLEIYCNDEWGTVCSDEFSSVEANVACNQLGYNDYSSYNHLTLQGTSTQKIWLDFETSGYSCYTYSSCLTSCQSCPSSEVTSCTHSQDVTLECEYETFNSKVDTDINDSCDIDLAGLIAAAIIGIIVSILICCCIIILLATVPLCICCCLGVGIGAVAGSSRRPKTTFVNSPATSQPAYPTAGGQMQAAPDNKIAPPSYDEKNPAY